MSTILSYSITYCKITTNPPKIPVRNIHCNPIFERLYISIIQARRSGLKLRCKFRRGNAPFGTANAMKNARNFASTEARRLVVAMRSMVCCTMTITMYTVMRFKYRCHRWTAFVRIKYRKSGKIWWICKNVWNIQSIIFVITYLFNGRENKFPHKFNFFNRRNFSLHVNELLPNSCTK